MVSRLSASIKSTREIAVSVLTRRLWAIWAPSPGLVAGKTLHTCVKYTPDFRAIKKIWCNSRTQRLNLQRPRLCSRFSLWIMGVCTRSKVTIGHKIALIPARTRPTSAESRLKLRRVLQRKTSVRSSLVYQLPRSSSMHSSMRKSKVCFHRSSSTMRRQKPITSSKIYNSSSNLITNSKATL